MLVMHFGHLSMYIKKHKNLTTFILLGSSKELVILLNNKSRTIFFFFLLTLLLFVTPNLGESQQKQNICELNFSNLDYSHFDFRRIKLDMYNYELDSDTPMLIDSDSDFISFGFPGNGSEQNPYLIQNLEINTPNNFGLVIVNTTKNFIVQNCNISAIITGIHLQNNSGIITEVFNSILFGGDYYGIYSYMCPNISIINNTCYNNEAGIGVFFSNNGLISENYCYVNEIGILAQFMIDTAFVANICDNNTYNIDCSYAEFLNISNNICSNSRVGIGGYAIDYSFFYNNTINLTDGGLIFYGCDNTEIIENCLTFNDIGIVHENGDNTNITGNECLESTRGIYIRDCHSTLVQENVCNKNSLDGIYIKKGSSALIVNNTCNDNLENGIYDSYWGMYIAEPHEIIGNSCNNNTYGIQLDITQRIEVFNNTCTRNLQGIILKDSDSTDIIFNVLQDNIEYGVYLDSKSTNNEIHHNDFINNNRKGTEFGKAQGYDDGFSNRWYDKINEEGNYWSNLRNKEEYLLDGLRNSIDPYPLNSPVNNDIPHKTNFNLAISVISLIVVTLCTLSLYRKKRRG
ncbi:MAG: hypothetical protein GPJ51_07550 [Candidatus Heimdallarchaeota archaeon]|nr:hypothetical protein [Candidatus Heimdallarchaeota archaeon]